MSVIFMAHQESILPNFNFLRFLFFAAKLECLQQMKKDLFTIKWSSLTAENIKNNAFTTKKFGKIDFRIKAFSREKSESK